MQIKRTLQKHPVLTFFVLAYVITGGTALTREIPQLSILAWISGYGPALAAILLTSALFGSQGMLDLFQRIFRWRVGLLWYLAALLFPLSIAILGIILYPLTAEWPNRPDWLAIAPRLGLAILALTPLGFPVLMGEEIGWRGFAQPHLQKRYSPLVTTLVIGVTWGLWHLPIWPRSTPLEFNTVVIFTLETTLMSFAYTLLYKRTQGSLIVVNLLHTFYDAIVVGFSKVVHVEPDSLLVLALYALVAVVALLLGGVKWFWKRPPRLPESTVSLT
jgi:membrane protease YdiL (CAAX protease family)